MKVCLAGSITKAGIEVLAEAKKTQPVNILQTFHDYQTSDGNFDALYATADFFLLDSGGFTMLYGAKKKVDIDEYVTKYIDFVKRKGIKHYVELDIYSIVGQKKTEQIRSRLEKEIGYPCVPVFQEVCGLDYYKKLIKEYDYIAIGGIAFTNRGGYPIPVLQQMLKLARQNGCRVHGLGFTSMKHLPETKWWSVDSTSWLSPVRFGGAIDVFNGTRIVKIKQPPNTRMITKKIAKHQLEQWLKFMDYARKF